MDPSQERRYFDRIEKELYSAVISDVLDGKGYRNQTMATGIRPIHPNIVMAGRARTVMAAEVNRIPEKPYAKQMEVLDRIKPGEVFVAAISGSKKAGFFGELMSTAVQVAGGRGAVIDGLTRDAKKIIEMGFPVFVAGFRPTDSLGRIEVVQYDIPIECGGVLVNPSDLVFGDMDGIVVVPNEIKNEVIESAFEKVEGENHVRQKISEGMKVSKAYYKYGIL